LARFLNKHPTSEVRHSRLSLRERKELVAPATKVVIEWPAFSFRGAKGDYGATPRSAESSDLINRSTSASVL